MGTTQISNRFATAGEVTCGTSKMSRDCSCTNRFHHHGNVTNGRLSLPAPFKFVVFTICEDFRVVAPQALQCLGGIFDRTSTSVQFHDVDEVALAIVAPNARDVGRRLPNTFANLASNSSRETFASPCSLAAVTISQANIRFALWSAILTAWRSSGFFDMRM